MWVVHPCCSADAASTRRHCHQPHHAICDSTVLSLLCCLCSPALEAGSPNFGWDSSVAAPELQGSGTSAMQKSIYSSGVLGRGWETQTDGRMEGGQKKNNQWKSCPQAENKLCHSSELLFWTKWKKKFSLKATKINNLPLKVLIGRRYLEQGPLEKSLPELYVFNFYMFANHT